jgi:hypothetical protein
VLQLFNHKDIQPQHDFFASQKTAIRGLTSARLARAQHLIIYQAYLGPQAQITRHMIKNRARLAIQGFSHHQDMQRSAAGLAGSTVP